MGRIRAEIERLAEVLLDPAANPATLRTACHELYEELLGLAGWDPDSPDIDRETSLADGVAISPRDAARCVLDFARTGGFLRAVDDAIRTMIRRRSGRPVELLYAGCGPLAPLVLPLLPRYSAEEVRVTLLEVNEGSLASARRTCEALDVSDRIGNAVLEDALEFEAPTGVQWDVMVMEMLQMALEKEPQVAVTCQLAPQLADDGILVPERISVVASLADLSTEFEFRSAGGDTSVASNPGIERKRYDLGTVMVLDRTAHRSQFPEDGGEASDDPVTTQPIVHRIPAALPAPQLTPILRTRIELAPGIVLTDYDSGLTAPRLLLDFDPVCAGQALEFRYRMGDRPGFEVRRHG